MNRPGYNVVGLFLIFLIYVIIFTTPIAFWTQSNLDFWMSYFKGHPIHVAYGWAWLMTFICNGFILAANIVASIARYMV